MADFESCYFCGAVPEGSLEEYAVVPRALDPSPDEQHSVVLCPACREKLTAVVRPVVEAAAGHRDGPVSGPRPDAPRERERVGGTAEPARTDERASGGPLDERGEPADAADPAASDPTARGRSDGPGSAGADESPSRGTGRSAAGPGDAVGAGPGPGGGGSGAGRDRNGPRRSGPGGARPDPHDDIIGRNSGTYGQVLRLLQNREFPVERDEIEQVAASAYELQPGEVSDAIDAMVRKGLLVDQGGTLRRG